MRHRCQLSPAPGSGPCPAHPQCGLGQRTPRSHRALRLLGARHPLCGRSFSTRTQQEARSCPQRKVPSAGEDVSVLGPLGISC